MNIVCIDPGHGGDDTGVVPASGAAEKDVVLSLAKQVGNACREARWQVSLTRIDDRDLPVEQRAFRANRTGATCFVSLHTCAGASGAGAAEGTRVIYQGGRGQGFALAGAVHEALVAGCGLPDGGIVAAPRLDLLRWCSIPAVLLEVREGAREGEAGVLETVEGRQRIAQRLAAALVAVFG